VTHTELTRSESPEAHATQSAPKVGEPVLVRRRVGQPTTFDPGSHSRNRKRASTVNIPSRTLRMVRIVLLILGVAGSGYYLYTLADQYIYQAYENWAFDQQIGGRPSVVFGDYLREKTAFGFLAGSKKPVATPQVGPVRPRVTGVARPAAGALLGRVTIARLNLAAVVREGVDAGTLSTAVGHVPSTALPGEAGNLAIAAHRDTLFRALKDIQLGDVVTFQSPQDTYTYQVEATQIVNPSDVRVLAADGGGLIQQAKGAHAAQPLLTMITCYPFYYVGSAPKRFIVEARLVPGMQRANRNETTVNVSVPKTASGKRSTAHHRRRNSGHKSSRSKRTPVA
jgi:sortase A